MKIGLQHRIDRVGIPERVEILERIERIEIPDGFNILESVTFPKNSITISRLVSINSFEFSIFHAFSKVAIGRNFREYKFFRESQKTLSRIVAHL